MERRRKEERVDGKKKKLYENLGHTKRGKGTGRR
jgi:hypothetical protein